MLYRQSIRMSNHLWVVTLIAVIATSPGCSPASGGDNDGSTRDLQTGESAISIDDMLARVDVNGNYVPLSIEEMVERSVAIAVGSFVNAKPGRSINWSPSIEGGAETKTMVAEFEASEVLLGDHDRFYVEFYVGANDGGFSSEIEQNEAIVFLHHYELPSDGSVEIIGEGAGHPKGTILHALTTPQAIVTEVSGGGRLAQPLEPNGVLLYDESVRSLAEFTSELITLIGER